MADLQELLSEVHLTVPRIRSLAKKAKNFRIGVIGDFYLDRYITGRMEAISREAPVPIVRVVSDDFSPGAAGNIAVNICEWGCQTSVLGVIGDDWVGKILLREFEQRGIDHTQMATLPQFITPNFNKIYAAVHGSGLQQVSRFDREPDPVEAETVQRLLRKRLHAFLSNLDAVILADYSEAAGRGWLTADFVQDIIRYCREQEVAVFATSRQRCHWLRGARTVVLNEVELMHVIGFLDQTLQETGETFEVSVNRVASYLGVDQLYLTLGERGMWVVRPGQAILPVPTLPQRGELDVTGAGDTALAAIVVGSLSGMGAKEVAMFANLCAGVVVRKIATTGTASAEEVIREIQLWRRLKGVANPSEEG